jgi:HlyD family secretion protein
MNKKYFWLVLAILLILGGYYGYKKTKSTTTEMQYVTTVVEKGTLVTSVSGSGNVIVDQAANVDPTITGTVASLAVNIGDSVRKGQLLFSIINNQLSVSISRSASSYQSSLSSLESAKASKRQAQADVDTSKTNSAADKEVLRKKLEAAEASVTSAEKNVQSSLADLNFQREEAAKRSVTAPIDGTVNAVNIKNGDDLSKLSSGSSRLVPIIIGDLGTLKAQVEVNEVDIPNVGIGQKATLTFDALPDFTATGKVEKIDALGTITQGVVTYNVTIGFDSLDSRIKPDMSVSVAITTDVKQNVITIPSGALKTQGGASYVEILSGGATVPTQVSVETGAANNTDTEILSGVKIGDNVVTQTINPSTTTSSGATSSSSTKSGSNARIPGIGGFGR